MARQDEPDIRLKVGFLRHPKTMRVRRELGSDGVLCLLNLLFFVRSNHHEDGGFGNLSDDDIEAVAEWHLCESHTPRTLIACLERAGLLDGGPGERRIHEWKEHQPFAAAFSQRSKAGKTAAKTRWAKTYGGCESHTPRIRSALPLASESNAPRYAPSPVPAHSGRNRRRTEKPAVSPSVGGLGAPLAAATPNWIPDIPPDPNAKPMTDAFFSMTVEERIANKKRIEDEREAERLRRIAMKGKWFK